MSYQFMPIAFHLSTPAQTILNSSGLQDELKPIHKACQLFVAASTSCFSCFNSHKFVVYGCHKQTNEWVGLKEKNKDSWIIALFKALTIATLIWPLVTYTFTKALSYMHSARIESNPAPSLKRIQTEIIVAKLWRTKLALKKVARLKANTQPALSLLNHSSSISEDNQFHIINRPVGGFVKVNQKSMWLSAKRVADKKYSIKPIKYLKPNELRLLPRNEDKTRISLRIITTEKAYALAARVDLIYNVHTQQGFLQNFSISSVNPLIYSDPSHARLYGSQPIAPRPNPMISETLLAISLELFRASARIIAKRQPQSDLDQATLTIKGEMAAVLAQDGGGVTNSSTNLIYESLKGEEEGYSFQVSSLLQPAFQNQAL